MWREYVPVATRLARAKRRVRQLRKKGKVIHPIEIEGRTIAKKFWGEKWCDHIETFSDYNNRLPRGRSYVRNGSVCHLAIQKGSVDALVAGSSLYNIKIDVKVLPLSSWQIIKNKCSGQISSLLELLTGNLSDHVMEIVTNSQSGLFPGEKEIEYSCNCLDWAGMCKHIAAVFYGIGHRLDENPELLFELRDVDPKELAQMEPMTFSDQAEGTFSDAAISDIFDIDLDEQHKKVAQHEQTNKKMEKLDSQTITKEQLKEFRLRLGLSVREFAKELGVTKESVHRWEKEKKRS
ncbi:MAG: helix-turn-helix domain-containing protein [Chlamydiota bacterium]